MTQYTGYFDYAAATPLSDSALRAMSPFASGDFYNPSALYKKGRHVRDSVESARRHVAQILEVKQQEIIFTSGCTESNNLAIHGIMSAYPDARILISAIEHESVREAAAQYTADEIPVDTEGRIDMDALARLLSDEVVLVSVMLANNEIGTVQDMRRIREVADKHLQVRKGNLPLYIHCDAAQAINYMPVRPHALGVDMLSINGGKIYGPKGSGCLFVSQKVKLKPVLFGGGQERGLRSGTENVAAIHGFSAALAEAQSACRAEAERLEHLRSLMANLLATEGCRLNGPARSRLSNNCNVILPGLDNETAVMKLDTMGYQVSSGSACHAASGIPSKVLKAIGLADDEIQSSIRISMGRFTTDDDVRGLCDAISTILAK